MEIVLIRHGEPNYDGVTKRCFIGHGRDLAELTENGIRQAEEVSRDMRLQGAELIVASPYTRALQTAAIISKNTGLNIRVETDLHEWLPDTTFQFYNDTYAIESSRELVRQNSIRTGECKYHWEELSSVAERAYRCLRKYMDYQKIIVVCHGIVMRQFVFQEEIPYCGILETVFDENSKWFGH